MRTSILLLHIFSLFLKCFCIGNGYEYTSCSDIDYRFGSTYETLVLIKTENNSLDIDRFYEKIKYIVPEVRIIQEICPGGVMGTIKALEVYSNADVVNLAVSDFYKFDYNYIISNNLNYAGEMGHKTTTFTSYVIQRNETRENDTIKNQTLRPVKLFSNRGKVDPIVYEYVHRFEEQSSVAIIPSKTNTLLICLDEIIITKDQIVMLTDSSEFTFHITNTSNCKTDIERLRYNILAVITNEEIETDDKMPFPILSHLTTQKSLSDNAITVTSSKSQQVYELALMQLLKAIGWHRIAILSDNYDHSVEFEEQIISIFDKEDFIYKLFRCEENDKGDYNFTEVINALESTDARIVILNIDKNNIVKLSEQMKSYRGRNYNFLWILNGDKFTDINSKNINNFVSIHLIPAISIDYISKQVEMFKINMVDKFKMKSLLECIIMIKKAVENIVEDEHSLFYQYRQLNTILKNSEITKTQVYITYKNRDRSLDILGTILFDGVGVTDEHYYIPFGNIPRDMDECAFRSRNFIKPCNNFELIYLMFVFVVFIITFFSITIFYSDQPVDYRQMQYRNL